jgi:hypothetical protein
VPKANRGLFTLKALAANVKIADYIGDVIERSELNRRYPPKRNRRKGKSSLPEYVLESRKNREWIDARDERNSGLSRYINHAPLTRNRVPLANCAFEPGGAVVTLHAIPAGAEIFVSYGPGYVTSHKLKPIPAKPSPLRLAIDLESIAAINNIDAYTASTLPDLQRLIAEAKELPASLARSDFIAAAEALYSTLQPILTPPAAQPDPPEIFENLDVPLETTEHVLLYCPHGRAERCELLRTPAFLHSLRVARNWASSHRPSDEALIPQDSAIMLHAICASPAFFSAIGKKQRAWCRKACDRFLRRRLCRYSDIAAVP